MFAFGVVVVGVTYSGAGGSRANFRQLFSTDNGLLACLLIDACLVWYIPALSSMAY